MKDKFINQLGGAKKNWSEKELQEWNEKDIAYHSPMEALAGKELQLFITSFWGVVYYYCLVYGNSLFDTIMGYFALGIGSLFLILFLVLHVIPKFWKWFIGLVAMVMIMSGCQHELKEGVIVAKHYEPSRDYIYMMPVAHMRMIGKVSSPYYTYVPILMHDDADYWVDIHGLTEKGKEKTESFYISSNRFDTVEIGKTFCVDSSCSKESNKDFKK